MNTCLRFAIVSSFLLINTHIFASETGTTYNFSTKAIESVPDIVQKANSPDLNDRINILDKLIMKVPHSDTLAYNFVYDLPPEDYKAIITSVIKGGLFTIKDIEKTQKIYIKIEKAITKFKLNDLLPEIVPLLEHNDPIIKLITLGILDQLEAKQYAKEIVKAASNPDIDINRPALRMLIKFDSKEAVPVLMECLKKEPPIWLRMGAIESLGRIGDPNAIPALIPYLKSDLYGQAIIALVELDAKETVPDIKDAMLSHWDEVLLLTSLAYFGDEQAISDIIEIIKKDIYSDNWDLYGQSTEFLGRLVEINARAAIPALINVLEQVNTSSDKYTRGTGTICQIMITLAKMNAKEAIPILRLYLKLRPVPSKTDDVFERTSIQALGILKVKEAIPDLIQRIESEAHYSGSRSEAIMALAMIGEPSTIKNIIEQKNYVWPEVLCQLAYTFNPDIYNDLLKKLPNIETLPMEDFVKQLNEKSNLRFALSKIKATPDEVKSRIIGGLSAPQGIHAIKRVLEIVNNIDFSKYRYAIIIDNGVIRFVEIEEAYDFWENWIAEYLKNHPDESNL